jgi:predicted metal-dependent HD superfamily phosphohydrolase
MATKNTTNKNDNYFVDALVNSWMVKNTIFDNDDLNIISSTWDARWEFLKDYFQRIAKDLPANGSANTIEGDEDGMDEIKNVITTWKEKIHQTMTEPPRYYHTHMHLEEMLGYMDAFIFYRGASLQQTNGWHRNESEETNNYNDETIHTIRATMTLAILFHDAIYDPKSDTNEEDSALLFCTFASELTQAIHTVKERLRPVHSLNPFTLSTSVFHFDRVKKYILATKYHNTSTTDDPVLAVFLDADMAVLGKVAAAYDVYAGRIRREFIHVDRCLYCRKRAQVLSSFLSNESIFSSPYMKDAFEVQARENLLREINLLIRDIIPGEIT